MKIKYKVFFVLLLIIVLFLLTGCESDILSSTIEIKQNSNISEIEKIIPKNNSYIINDNSTVSYFYNRNIFKIDDNNYQARYTERNLDTNKVYLRVYYLKKIGNTWEIGQTENHQIKGDK